MLSDETANNIIDKSEVYLEGEFFLSKHGSESVFRKLCLNSSHASTPQARLETQCLLNSMGVFLFCCSPET